MTWLIESFEGMGPIRFGMTPGDVAAVVGAPDRSRKGLRPGTFKELRGIEVPIVRYTDNRVTEIEAFYELQSVTFQKISVFQTSGAQVLRQLEELNGGAMISVGIVLFNNLGLTAGRLDDESRTGHSITAFKAGIWNDKIADFENFSFS